MDLDPETEKIESTPEFQAYQIKNKLEMRYILDKFDKEEPFSAIKLCHGFWEKCARIERRLRELGIEGQPDSSEVEKVINDLSIPWPVDLFFDTIPLLQSADSFPNVHTLVSPFGWSQGHEIEGTPYEGLENTTRQIGKFVSSKAPLYDGLFWKNSVQDGSISLFIEKLRDRNVIVVGPNYVRFFADFCRLQNSVFVEVDVQRAAWYRSETLASISKAVEKSGGSHVVCLIQAGEFNSAWLVYKLSQRFPLSSFMVLGQALNLGSWETLKKTNWYAVHHRSINKTAIDINRRWAASESKDYYANLGIHLKSDQALEYRLKNYEPTLYELVTDKVRKSEPSAKFPVPFIESKSVDIPLLQQILRPSVDRNHWANFGPAVGALEEAIAKLLNIPRSKSVVSCKSATDALSALVGMHEFNAGHKLNWIVSAFGFVSTHTGLLSRARVIDCDPSGIISLPELKKIDPDTWDGLIITNTFSLAEDLVEVTDYARSLGKRIIVDNAAAMFAATRESSGNPDEVLSFHHTKPWGVGEGGCVIVDSEGEACIRSLTNYGVGLERSAQKYAQNSKMSDFDAALILQRLVNMPNWRPLYELQKRRIMSIAEPLGFSLLMPSPKVSVSAHVPLLAPKAVNKDDLVNPYLTLRKYYEPLATGNKNAGEIFERIVCVPCHPNVADCPTADIERVLKSIAD